MRIEGRSAVMDTIPTKKQNKKDMMNGCLNKFTISFVKVLCHRSQQREKGRSLLLTSKLSDILEDRRIGFWLFILRIRHSEYRVRRQYHLDDLLSKMG